MRMERTAGRLGGLALCALFAVLAMGCALLAGGVYGKVTQSAGETYESRVAVAYVANQLRRGNAAETVSVVDFDGASALRLAQEEGYEMLLYVWEGQFRELYAATDSGALPADGEALFPMREMAVDAGGGLVTVTLTQADGRTHTVTAQLTCGEVAA